MAFLSVLGPRLTEWLGADTLISFDHGPVEFEADDGTSVWLLPDHHYDQLIFACALIRPFAINAQRSRFLLELSNPCFNEAGLAIGADAESGVVSVSRRYDARVLDEHMFQACLETVAGYANALPRAAEALSEEPVVPFLNDFALRTPAPSGGACAVLADAFEGTEVPFRHDGDGTGLVAFDDAIVLCEDGGDGTIVRALSRAEHSQQNRDRLIEIALLQNLFLGRCASAGCHLDNQGRLGAFQIVAHGTDLVQAFCQAAAHVVGDLRNLSSNLERTQEADGSWHGPSTLRA